MGRVQVQLHSFLSLALDHGQRSASHLGHFTSMMTTSSRSWECHATSDAITEKTKIFVPTKTWWSLDSPVIQITATFSPRGTTDTSVVVWRGSPTQIILLWWPDLHLHKRYYCDGLTRCTYTKEAVPEDDNEHWTQPLHWLDVLSLKKHNVECRSAPTCLCTTTKTFLAPNKHKEIKI
jgi:hypothetical protein